MRDLGRGKVPTAPHLRVLESGMRVLVTGSSGLIGRELVSLMRAASIEVIPYDLSQCHDICNADQLARAMHGCDGVVHLAAISRVAWGEADPGLCRKINIDGTACLLAAALAREKQPWVVFASSREVYGDPDLLRVCEEAAIRPVNHYGQSKAEGEALVRDACGAGLRVAIVRLSNVYGTVHDHPDRAVPSLLWRAMAGETLCLSGPNAYFDFVHVADTARGLIAAVHLLGHDRTSIPTIHLSTGIATTLAELASQVVDVARSASSVEHLPARSFDVKGFCGDPARAAAVLGWHPRIDLATGLRQFHAVLTARGRPLDPVLMPSVPSTGSVLERTG